MEQLEQYPYWVKQAQSGEAAAREDAFEELMRAFQDQAERYAYAMLGDYQLAEDATQDAFITVYRRLDQLRDPAAFPGWLRQIIRTQCSRLLRRREPTPLTAEDSVQDSTADPEAQLEVAERERRLRVALAHLTPAEREVTERFYLHGESQHEIAERLGIPLTTVKKRLQYARQRLRGLVTEFAAFELGAVVLFVLFGWQQLQPALQPAYAYAVIR